MSKRPHRSPSPSSPPPPSQPSKYTRSVSPSDSPSTMTPSLSLSSSSTAAATMTCTLPTCPQRTHQTTESFEIHYNKYHTNRCHDCLKNFPTSRILECHIRENHDMFAVLKKEKGEKIYACFVEDCDKICISFGKRRAHLIDKHYYHKNFNFSIVDSGIDRATSLLTSPPRKSRTRVRRVSEASNNTAIPTNTPSITTIHENTPNTSSNPGNHRNGGGEENGMDIDSDNTLVEKPNTIQHGQKQSRKHTRSASEPSTAAVIKETRVEQENNGIEKGDKVKEGNGASKNTDDDTIMTDLATKMSAIRFVPPSVVRFGRRGGASGFSKK
ncbi:hypothetical protein TWF718_003818 [Orbilia javanica]|uniref:C2H2-type domain-containing protein n=1 Tax=Orbilia javanica TaxID=47235 RepID=A0AAN8NYV3_9PEZI